MPTVIANFLMSLVLLDKFHASSLSVKDVFVLGVDLIPRFTEVLSCVVFDMNTGNTVFLIIIKLGFFRFFELDVFLILNVLY